MSKVPDRGRPSLTARIGISVPAAIGAVLFAGAVAFGSGMVDTFVPGHGGEAAYHGGAHAGHAGGAKGWHDTENHHGDGNEDSKPPYQHPDKTPKPEPKPDPTPAPNPGKVEPPAPVVQPPADQATLTLNAEWLTGKVKFTWSAFTGDGFGYYKLVRSKDAEVTWPPGGNDSLVAYISDPNQTFAKDDFARGLLSAMRAGETVGLLMDQNMTPPQGVFVPFFGVPACTASGSAR